jgi:hypothetical protein
VAAPSAPTVPAPAPSSRTVIPGSRLGSRRSAAGGANLAQAAQHLIDQLEGQAEHAACAASQAEYPSAVHQA